jgi:hypothetical protein
MLKQHLFMDEINPNTRIIDMTWGQFVKACETNGLLSKPEIVKQEKQDGLEWLSDVTARTVLGGGKPISKNIFNKLRKEGKIQTYFPSPGRTAYNLAELRKYISTTGKESPVLPAKRKPIK